MAIAPTNNKTNSANSDARFPHDFAHANAFLQRTLTILNLYSKNAGMSCVPMEAAMGSFKRSHAFDPLDLEIIDLVYEVACEQISAREPSRDMAEDEEWENTLRKSVFALAGDGGVDFDTLLDRVLASLPQPLRQQPTDRDYV